MHNLAKNKVEYKFAEFAAFIKKTGLSKVDTKDVVRWGEVYGHMLHTNHAGLYRDDDFEKLLVSRCINEYKLNFEQVKSLKELHIISEPLASGGHTRLMEKVIALRECSDVLITRPIADVESKLRLPCNTKIYQKKQGFDLEELIKILVKYKTIFLHINPDDLLTSVAVGVVKNLTGTQVIFVNHADHVFSFGFYCSDLVAEVSAYGFFLSQRKRAVCSSFLGIPLKLDEFRKIELNSDLREGRYFEILSAGSPLKYKPTAALSFSKLVTRLLKEIPAARVTIIGPQVWFNWWWWWVKLSNPFRLRILKSKSYDKYIATLAGADIYLDSFPMTGGTALPEVRSKGIPVSGLLCGSSGYTPFDALKFSNEDDMVNSLKDYSLGQGEVILKKNNNQNVIDAAFCVHGLVAIKHRLQAMVDHNAIFRSYDENTIFDMSFYRNQWRSAGVININYCLFVFFVKNWFSGGKEVLFFLIYLIGAKQSFRLMGYVSAKFFLSKS